MERIEVGVVVVCVGYVKFVDDVFVEIVVKYGWVC